MTKVKYKCECGYVYDQAVGDIKSNIPPETPFGELPDNWTCPECGASQDRFDLIKLEGMEIDDQEGEEAPSISLGKRNVYTGGVEQKSIRELDELYRDGDLDIQPYFQRRPVWDGGKRSRLIESVLLDVPIPMFYFAEREDGELEVIDGQQRLRAFFDFLDNEFALRALDVKKDLINKKFKNLEKALQRKLKITSLPVVIVKKESDSDVKFDIFKRLNTGAVQLNDQELRNCIYRGLYNGFISKMAQSEKFLSLLGLKEPDPRMKDVEFVLRFFAFFNQTYLKYDTGMKRFLNREMENHKNFTESEKGKLKNVFEDALDITETVFGDKAFKKFYIGNEKDPNGNWEMKKVNKSLFDIVMWGFTRYQKNQVIPHADALREELLWLMSNDQEFSNAITYSTNDRRNVEIRFKKWLDSLEVILGWPSSEPRDFSWSLKKQLYDQNPVCAICEQKIMVLDDAELDHIEFYWRGGKTITKNARLVHRYCNRARGGGR